MDLNRRYSDNDPCWLVKVDTRISGPWSFNEVLVKLTKGELKPYHEASSPMDRWRSLQSQPLFSAAIERLKKQQQTEATGEHTFTAQTDVTSFTRTVDLSGDRITPTPMAESVTPPPNFKVPPVSTVNPVKHNYNDPEVFLKPAKKNNNTTIAVVAGLCVTAFVLFMLFGKKNESLPLSKNQFLDYTDRGLAYKKNADWYEALKQFKKAYQMNNKDVDLVFEMAPLLVQVENQTMYTRNILEKIMYGQYKKENLSAGKNILGLSFSYEGQYKMAIKNFDEVLKDDEGYYPAKINKGYALLLSGDYPAAEEALMDALTEQNGSSLPYIYLIESYIFDGVKNNNRSSLEKAFNLASKSADKFYDGKQELLLFQAFAALKLGHSPAAVQSTLQKALVMDPEQTLEHVHSPLVDWRGLNWQNFSFICNDFSRAVKPDLISLLEFVCTYKTNNEMAAQQLVSGWMNRSPNSPWPHVAQAILGLRLGEFDKAQMSLNLAKAAGANDKLYHEVQSKVCIRLKDVSCLRKNYEPLAKLSPLHAFTAKAQESKLSNKDPKQMVYGGLRESSNYIPLIRMQ